MQYLVYLLVLKMIILNPVPLSYRSGSLDTPATPVTPSTMSLFPASSGVVTPATSLNVMLRHPIPTVTITDTSQEVPRSSSISSRSSTSVQPPLGNSSTKESPLSSHSTKDVTTSQKIESRDIKTSSSDISEQRAGSDGNRDNSAHEASQNNDKNHVTSSSSASGFVSPTRMSSQDASGSFSPESASTEFGSPPKSHPRLATKSKSRDGGYLVGEPTAAKRSRRLSSGKSRFLRRQRSLDDDSAVAFNDDTFGIERSAADNTPMKNISEEAEPESKSDLVGSDQSISPLKEVFDGEKGGKDVKNETVEDVSLGAGDKLTEQAKDGGTKPAQDRQTNLSCTFCSVTLSSKEDYNGHLR